MIVSLFPSVLEWKVLHSYLLNKIAAPTVLYVNISLSFQQGHYKTKNNLIPTCSNCSQAQTPLIHSHFPSVSVVSQFQLPKALLGGQPRRWGVELGFRPAHLDGSVMSVQKIPTRTSLADYVQSVGFEGCCRVPSSDLQQRC